MTIESALSNKRVALVAGGSGTLGTAICRALADAGFSVIVGYASRADAAASVAEAIHEHGGNAQHIRLVIDGAGDDGPDAVVRRVRERHGRLDALVNCVGLNPREAPAGAVDDADWQVAIDVNLTGAFRLSRAAATGMAAARWGRIVHLSSVAAAYGGRGQIGYAAAKAGVEAMVRVLALEFGRKGVTVNGVRPGVIVSPMTERVRVDHEDILRERIAARRFGTPDDVAAAVTFLCSDAAGYVNGQILAVDGGMGLG